MIGSKRLRKKGRIDTEGSCTFKKNICECKFELGKEFGNMQVQNAYVPEKNIELLEKVKLFKDGDTGPMSDDKGLLTIQYAMDEDKDNTCEKLKTASIRQLERKKY